MKKSDFKILIVEDDSTMGRALEEAFKRSGYSASLANGYQAAKGLLKLHDFHGFVIDCMLPLKSGVDLAAEINKDYSDSAVIALTSGIFKDRAFVADAQFRTKARGFFQKPFDIEDVLALFDESFRESSGTSQEPLFELLSRHHLSPGDRINAINSTQYIHGLDLPYVYSLLMVSGVSGCLNIQYEDKTKAEVYLSKGKIVNLKYHDTESYFGALLVEKGFVSFEEIESGLKKKGAKTIGQYLVDESAISPHAIELVGHAQIVIRLSKTIRDTNISVNFKEMAVEEEGLSVEGFEFTELLNDWILSKVNHDWLKTFYTPWLEHQVVEGPEISKLNLVKSLPVVAKFISLIGGRRWPMNLQDLLAMGNDQENDLFRGLHFLMLQRVLAFSEYREDTKNVGVKLDRLQKVWASMEHANHFEVLGLGKGARATEIQRAYIDLAKSFHPDKLMPGTPDAIRDLSQKIFAKISDANEILSDEKKKANYRRTLEIGLADDILKAETSFEEGYKLLQTSRFRDARKTFERTLKMKGHRSDTIVYLTWALIKEKRHGSNRGELIEKCHSLLSQVAHEDRHTPQYIFAKGMYYELNGQIDKAFSAFKHAISIDQNFIDARRELAFIKQNYKQKTKTLSDDLSVVVTKLFGRKSS